MNKLSVESLIDKKKHAQTVDASRTALILSAWLGTLLLSRLPQIALSELGIIASSDWSLWWWVFIGTALILLTYAWSSMKPLRGYFLVMTMIYVATILRGLLQQTSLWISWFGSERPWLASFFGERMGIVLMGLALAGFLSLLGRKRSDYFLTIGNITAPASGMHLTWKIAGPLLALLLAALTAAAILAMNPLSSAMLVSIIPLLPAVFILALMNAFGEELAFRAAPLSQVWEVVGKRQSIWMTALWFGLGHYYGGIAFGAAGAIFITLTAVLLGKAMLETKGMAIPVLMHLMIDVMIYIVLALGSP